MAYNNNYNYNYGSSSGGQLSQTTGYAAMQGAGSSSKTFVPGRTLNYHVGIVGKRRARTEEE